jgi:hypothetical protein
LNYDPRTPRGKRPYAAEKKINEPGYRPMYQTVGATVRVTLAQGVAFA